MIEREHVTKLRTGEYLHEWNGYSPFFCGSYGSSVCFGGEKKYYHCFGSFFGVCSVDWWVKEELDKLTEAEIEDLLSILHRNKTRHDFITYDKVYEICDSVGLSHEDSCLIYRLGNKKIFEMYNSESRKELWDEYKPKPIIKIPYVKDTTENFDSSPINIKNIILL